MVNTNSSEVQVGRSVVLTLGGVVASASPLAASVGVQVMKEGGNAFDAAVATAAAEAVTLCTMCGIGGEPFVLMYEAKTGRTYGLTGSGKAPAAATREFFVSQGYEKMPLEGALSVAIPGEVDAYETILNRFGTMPLVKLLEPAIGYAEEGFPIAKRVSKYFRSGTAKLNRYPDSPGSLLKTASLRRLGMSWY